MAAVGSSTRRADGLEKVSGTTRYTGDIHLSGMLHARLLLSPHPSARIVGLDRGPALGVPGVSAVVTCEDLARVGEGMRDLLADGVARYVGEPIAVVLGVSEASAADGLDALRGGARFEPLQAALTIDEALAEGAPLVRRPGEAAPEDEEAEAHAAITVEQTKVETPSNVANRVVFSRGNTEEALRAAEVVVRRTYTTSRIHQGYIEPQSTLAAVDPVTGELTIYTSTQGHFYVRAETAKALGLPQQKVRVVSMAVGGAFGGKILNFQPLAGALALLTRRPVRLELTRHEDFMATEPAPASRIEVELGAMRDGTLCGLRGRIWFDSGSAPGSPLTVAAVLLGGYYRFPSIRLESAEVLTNKPPAGAYRAPGAVQATFAIESAMDEMATLLGIDPVAFRLRHASRPGDPMPHGRLWAKMGLREVLEAIDAHPLRKRPRREDEGTGIAIGGWPGGLESASACVRANTDGTFQVIVGAVDLTGTATAMAQIAAEVLGVAPGLVQVVTPDTSHAPYAGLAGGSKTTLTVGAAVRLAAEDARRQILSIAADHIEARPEDLEIAEGQVRVRGTPAVALPLAEIATMSMRFGAKYPPVFGQGSTAITRQSPGFAGHIVRARVDRDTGGVTVLDHVVVQDVGFAINPGEIKGQILGGVAQGVGWALQEEVVYDASGALLTSTFADYAVPRSTAVPDVESILVEVPSDDGPFGARGVGEPPVVAAAAAIANAVADAAGVRVTDLPASRERLWRLMRERDRQRQD